MNRKSLLTLIMLALCTPQLEAQTVRNIYHPIVLSGLRDASFSSKDTFRAVGPNWQDKALVTFKNCRHVEWSIHIEGNGICDGIAFDNCNFMKVDAVHVKNCKRGIVTTGALWMSEFNRVRVSRCNHSAFAFTGDKFKTTLTFRSCWAENSNRPWSFKNTVGIVMDGCGSDWCNPSEEPNPYGSFKVPVNHTTKQGIYHFSSSSGVINGTGAENSNGNGIFYIHGTPSTLTFNSPYSRKCKGYHDNKKLFAGPIMTSGTMPTITVNSGTDLQFSSIASSNKAPILAYNGNDQTATGIRATVNGSRQDEPIAGQNPTVIANNTRSK